jgi:glycosyltransferase involved in cell wall biosynthesis
MRILYMIPWFHSGTGQETTIQQIVMYGQNLWDSSILSNRFTTYPGVFPDGYSVNLITMRQYYSLMLPFRKIPAWIKQYDIIHIKSGAPYLWWLNSREIPLIYTLQGPWITKNMGYRGKLQGTLANLTEGERLLKKADALVGVSPWICKYYKERMGLELTYIPDSFDLHLFQYVSKLPDPGSLRLLIVGDWDGFNGRKRQHELIQLMPMLAGEFPGINLRLVGLTHDSMDKLREFAEQKGAAKFISLEGKLSEPDLAQAYASSDILVVTSTFEGFHRPTVESMASGTPVLARDTTSIVGALYSSHFLHVKASGGGETFGISYDDITEKIWKIIENYKKMAAKGFEYSRQFENSTVLPKYEKLYNELISKRGR